MLALPTDEQLLPRKTAESLAGRMVPVPYVGSAVLSQELLQVAGAPASWSSGDAIADMRLRSA